MDKFYLRLLILTLTLAAIIAAVFLTVLQQFYLSIFPFALGFVALITGLVYWLVSRSMDKKFVRFSNAFLSATTLKLFAFLIFIGIYLFLRRENAFIFTTFFFCIYIVFSVFEIKQLLLRNKKKK